MKIRILAAAALASLLVAACGGKQDQPQPVQGAFGGVMDGAPDWVQQGCDAHPDVGEMLCGVGIVQGTRNLNLARSTAQSRGRAEIARTLETHAQLMMEDYQATVTGGDLFGVAADDEQMIVDVQRHVTDQSLHGARQIDQWVSRDGSSFFSLMALDTESVHTAVQSMEALPPQIRRQVEESSRRAFERLDDQLGR